ncbi:MAG: hypothetical protein L0K86_02330 [Actinomycetia bacterium]|nr:hypothetical protein [Actinomycetes bacterium]
METTTSSTPVLAGGLVLAAAGLIVQILTGVPGFPLIPPGPIILLAAAAVVVWWRWRWAPAVGLLAALFIAVGAVMEGSVFERLTAPAAIGPFAGSAIQLLGLAVAILAGAAALARAR